MANIAWGRVAARFEGIAAEQKPHTVTTPDARRMLDADPDLIVIDARLEADATTVPVRLRGARRAPPHKVDEVAASLPPGAKVLVYCAWGFEIGGNAAARLRERGIDAVAVDGGIGAWRADGLPTEPISGEPLKEGETK
jgi:Fe-Mn family superoxide dismutase